MLLLVNLAFRIGSIVLYSTKSYLKYRGNKSKARSMQQRRFMPVTSVNIYIASKIFFFNKVSQIKFFENKLTVPDYRI
jgi:hypothetical protein